MDCFIDCLNHSDPPRPNSCAAHYLPRLALQKRDSNSAMMKPRPKRGPGARAGPPVPAAAAARERRWRGGAATAAGAASSGRGAGIYGNGAAVRGESHPLLRHGGVDVPPAPEVLSERELGVLYSGDMGNIPYCITVEAVDAVLDRVATANILEQPQVGVTCINNSTPTCVITPPLCAYNSFLPQVRHQCRPDGSPSPPDLYVTCELFLDGQPISLPARTGYKPFSATPGDGNGPTAVEAIGRGGSAPSSGKAAVVDGAAEDSAAAAVDSGDGRSLSRTLSPMGLDQYAGQGEEERRVNRHGPFSPSGLAGASERRVDSLSTGLRRVRCEWDEAVDLSVRYSELMPGTVAVFTGMSCLVRWVVVILFKKGGGAGIGDFPSLAPFAFLLQLVGF